MSDGRVEYEIAADASGLAAAARRGEGALGGMESKGKVMAAGLTTAIAGVTAAAGVMGLALRESAKIEATTTGIRTIVKDAQLATAVMEDLNKIASQTPRELDEIANAARGLLGSGTSIRDLNSQLLFLGDIASGAQTDLGGIVTVFNQIRQKGKLTTEELLQLKERGVAGLDQELSKITGIEVEQLSDAITKGKVGFEDLNKALISMTSEGGLYFRASANEAETLNGKLSTLKDAFNSLLRVPGDAGLGPAKAFVDTLTNGLIEAESEAKVFVKTLSMAAENGNVGELLSVGLRLAFAKSTMFFLEGMKSAVMTVATALGDAIIAALSGDVGAIKDILKTAFDFSPGGMIRDVLQIDELEKRYEELTNPGRDKLSEEDAAKAAKLEEAKQAADAKQRAKKVAPVVGEEGAANGAKSPTGEGGRKTRAEAFLTPETPAPVEEKPFSIRSIAEGAFGSEGADRMGISKEDVKKRFDFFRNLRATNGGKDEAFMNPASAFNAGSSGGGAGQQESLGERLDTLILEIRRIRTA